ncbi:hypothetical protein [Xanthobacter agilis]|uniref:Uncharacterized protein n=1 Tax=Xanthobacter agilis TaxID=47492 RepID=A0ABU0LK11_XANAG|nr:hypothetical protein [Xanthobacter agilis]MDQ0507437.1 hypothetical protein [Xanthobacter agilis]
MTTLGEYMRWLQSQGGHCSTGIGPDDAIGMIPVTKLVALNGRKVIHYGNDQSEVLAPSLIEHFDRRLHVMSPFPTVKRG